MAQPTNNSIHCSPEVIDRDVRTLREVRKVGCSACVIDHPLWMLGCVTWSLLLLVAYTRDH